MRPKPPKPRAGGRFQPGQSGNPGGRPVIPASVRDLARAASEDSIRTLIWLRDHAKAESVRLAAAEALLDRAWGRPAQEIIASGTAPTFQLVLHRPLGTDPTAGPGPVLEAQRLPAALPAPTGGEGAAGGEYELLSGDR